MATGSSMSISSNVLRKLPTSRGFGDADRFKRRFAKDDLISALEEALDVSKCKI
jgi:hypothetical protein